jgi:CheY-like chemotaxis protein
LTIIIGYSDLLLTQHSESDPARELLKEIQKAGDRASSLTRQLLAFSRKQVLAPKVLSLSASIGELEKMLRRLIGENIELHTELQPNLDMVKVDPGQVEQVILNLAVNARDAMPDGGSLTLRTANRCLDATYAQIYPEVTPGAYVELTVTDTGCGMDENIKGHLFEPFFTTKDVGKGTGLGLATVYGIVMQSEGHLTVESAVGQGTTFHIYFPRMRAIEPALPSQVREMETPGGTERILLVEDDAGVRGLARLVLRRRGYTVLEARDGMEALAIASDYPGSIDLLITDVVLPGMNGRELAASLVSGQPGLKVLYMSGYTDDEVLRLGILEKDVPFLQKPLTPGSLARKVRDVLGAKAVTACRRQDPFSR